MKNLLFIVTFFVGVNVYANESKTTLSQAFTPAPSIYAMEPSLSVSSINNGSRFMSIALVARVASWLSLGVEGDLPADFERQEQFYMGRILGRVHLLKSINSMYLQGSGSVGFFNGAFGGTDNFAALGALFGYMRTLSDDWEVGGRVGVQLVNSRFSAGEVASNGETFNNRLSLVGAYRF